MPSTRRKRGLSVPAIQRAPVKDPVGEASQLPISVL